MNIAKIDKKSVLNSKKLIRRVLSATLDNPNNPDSLNFFHADTYRFYFLMSFMWEFFESNEIVTGPSLIKATFISAPNFPV